MMKVKNSFFRTARGKNINMARIFVSGGSRDRCKTDGKNHAFKEILYEKRKQLMQDQWKAPLLVTLRKSGQAEQHNISCWNQKDRDSEFRWREKLFHNRPPERCSDRSVFNHLLHGQSRFRQKRWNLRVGSSGRFWVSCPPVKAVIKSDERSHKKDPMPPKWRHRVLRIKLFAFSD